MRENRNSTKSHESGGQGHIINLMLQKFTELSTGENRVTKDKRLNTGLLRTPGSRLLAIRKDLGHTQPQMAEAMVQAWKDLQQEGVDGNFNKPGASSISDWETDKREIPREVALIVAHLWKTTTDFLLCAPWAESEHRPGENNGIPTYWHPEVDAAAAQLDQLEPGLRRLVVRRLPSIIDWLRSEWQATHTRLANMREEMVKVMGEDAVKEWERNQGMSLGES